MEGESERKIEGKIKKVERELNNELEDRNDEKKSVKKNVDNETNNDEDKVLSQIKLLRYEMEGENSKEEGDRQQVTDAEPEEYDFQENPNTNTGRSYKFQHVLKKCHKAENL